MVEEYRQIAEHGSGDTPHVISTKPDLVGRMEKSCFHRTTIILSLARVIAV